MKTFPLLLSLLLIAACGDGDDTRIEATGTIEATDVTISAQVAGAVVSLRTDEGLKVGIGDTLVILDQREWRLQARQAEANLAAAEAQYRLAVRGARAEDLRQAEAADVSARRDLERMKELRASNSIPQKQLDDAELRATVAQQTLEKLKNGSRPEEIDAMRARRDQAAAQLALLQKKLDDCVVTSPAAGTVLNRFVERGEFVGMGSALIRIANLEEMDLMIYVPETQLPRIKIGQTASLSVDAFKDRTFEGRVVFISSTAEFTPKNIQTKDERTKLVFGVKIRVENPDGALKAGIPADVVL
ncbi:MAG: efflux RND transporter periplasmic adaptor subunit [Bacteroidetes bacterium]|jgi:HlyD family secretion protein|nr:efflux RND transporter periplasmic adaptor subunit [Bacteroidota bacterium]